MKPRFTSVLQSVGRQSALAIGVWWAAALLAVLFAGGLWRASPAGLDLAAGILVLAALVPLGVPWREMAVGLLVCALAAVALAWVTGSPADFRLLAYGAVVPVMEESLYRGFYFKTLRDRLGTLPALILSSLLFALMHMTPRQMGRQAVLGVALTVLYQATGSLPLTSLAHAAHNAVVLLVLGVGGKP